MVRLQLIFRTLKLVWESAKGWTLLSFLILLMQAILPVASLYLLKQVVDTITAGIIHPNNHHLLYKGMFYVGLLGSLALLGAILNTINGVVSEIHAQTVTDFFFRKLHTKSYQVDLEHYESPNYYDTLYRAQQDAPTRPARIINSLAIILQNSISLILIAGMLFSFHAGLTLLVLAAVVPGIFVGVAYSRRLLDFRLKNTKLERQAWYFHSMLSVPDVAKEIRLFELGQLFAERYQKLREALRIERFRIIKRRCVVEVGVQSFAAVTVYGSMAFISYQALRGIIQVGDVVMYYQAFQRGQSFLKEILSSLTSLYEDSLFLSSFYEFLDLEPKIVDPCQPQPFPSPIQKGIVFDQVNFQYPNSDRYILKGINFTIKPGQVIALVGENGSGKTTLIKLLCRLYDPSSGSIAVDGVDYKQLRPTALRSEIGVIFQDYAKYRLTARENIWFGNARLSPDDERILMASRRSGADAIISKLPQGYETILGKWLGDGEELSIGQWQQVALARAFIRESQVVVLDEPTSAMDARAEYEVFARIRQLAQGRAVILISHRFSTVRMADLICVMENGQIIESGTHESLMDLNGKYAHLFQIQAQYYQ